MNNNTFNNTDIRVNPSATICVREINVKYGSEENEVWAVRDASLDIMPGELTIISGLSGSGKSTLLNVIGGMLKPTSGRVYFKGKDITDSSDREWTAYRRDVIGFVFQDYSLIADLTALENVNLAASMSDNSMSAEEALELVGIGDCKNKYPFQMSGGQQQRVGIARAIVKKAALFLCDEPTGALDVENSAKIISLLEDIAHKQGIAVVIITHNMDIAKMADHSVVIADGRIVEGGINA